jgi:hypothetical protein
MTDFEEVKLNDEENLSSNSEIICRICLENSDLSDLIYPCKCAGNSKYVHKKCLNEWRSINHNPDNFYRCEVCKYKYNIVKKENSFVNCAKCLIKNWFPFFILNYGLMYLIGSIIFNVDKINNFSILNNLDICTYKNSTVYLNNEKVDNYFITCNAIIEPENFIIFYALISGLFILMLTIILIFISFLFIKNKKMYCNSYSEQLKILTGIFIFYVAFTFLFSYTFFECTLVMHTICMYLIHAHLRCFLLISESNMSYIENYEGGNNRGIEMDIL